MRWLLLCLLLYSCGGGGGGSPVPNPGTIVPTVRHDLIYTYFGIGDGQIAATANTVNAVMVPGWGPRDTPAQRQAIAARQIAQMQEARARGVDKFILMTDFLLFDARWQYRGIADLVQYKVQLDALDLSRSVVAAYPVDEPDMNHISPAIMTRVFTESAAAWPLPQWVIYGDHGTPGIQAATGVGIDRYQSGAGVLDMLPAIRPDQCYLLIPGGANPYRQDPVPFADYAYAHPQVCAMLPFIFTDYTDPSGTPQLGIGRNGLAPVYEAIGAAIRG